MTKGEGYYRILANLRKGIVMNTFGQEIMKCEIKRKPRSFNSYTLNFKGLTRGEILNMLNALQVYDTPIAKDTRGFLVMGIEQSGNEELKGILK